MVDVTSRLRLVVDSTGLDRGGRSLRNLREEARRADEQARRLQSAFAGLAGVLGAAFSLREITRVVDEYRGIENQLRLVTSGAEDLRRAQEGVLRVANETGAALNSTAQLFGNLERFAGEFLTTQQDALDLTRAINQAAAISGAGVQEASNAVRQLSQGIAGGILRAEEFNSIVENMPRLAQALADGLGTSLGGLRKLVNEGSVTSEALIAALQTQFGALNNEFLGTSRTIGQAMQSLGNIVTVELGQRFAGAQDLAVKALQLIAENIDTIIPLAEGLAVALAAVGAGLAFPAIAAGIAALISPLGLVAASIAAIVAFRDDIAQTFTGFDNAGAVIRVLASDLKDLLAPVIAQIVALAEAASEAIGNLIQIGRERTQAGLISRDQELSDKLRVIQDERRALAEQLATAIAVGDEFEATILTATDQKLASRFERLRAQRGKIVDEINRLNDVANGQNSATGYLADVGERARELQVELEKSKTATAAIADEMKSVALVTGAASKEAERLAKKAEEARKAIAQDQADQEYLIERARLGERELRIAREVLAIRRQIGGVITDELLATAERNVELDEQLKLIQKQRDLLSDIFDELFGDASALWRIFFDDGQQAISSIRGLLNNLFDGIRIGKIDIRGITGDIRTSVSDLFNGSLANTEEGRRRQQAFGSAGAQLTRDFLPRNGNATSELANTLNNIADLAAQSNPYAALAIIGGRLGIGAADAIDGNGANETTAAFGQFFGFIGGLISGLVSKASNNFGRVQLDAEGNIVGTEAKDRGRGDQNLSRAEQFASGVSAIVEQLEQIIGGTAGSIAGGIQFDDRKGISFLDANTNRVIKNFGNDAEEALAYVVGRAIDGLSGGSDELVTAAQNMLAAGDSVETMLENIARLASINERLLQETDPLLASLNGVRGIFGQLIRDAEALGMATGAGSNVSKIVAGDLERFFQSALSNGNTIGDLTSRLEEFQDVLGEVGVAAETVSEALSKVAAAERAAFDEQIQTDITGFLTGPVDQLNALLKAQKERADQAIALGADLAEVERLTNLELRGFFEGLSEDAIAEVSSFLGLFEEASDSVMRQLDLSRQDLQGLADSFGRFAQDFANLNTQFTEQFIAASPRESIGILQARATELLGQVRGGNESAAQALPQVLQQLVQNARDTFGNTQGFTDVLAFAQQTLTEAEQAALGIQSDAERQIAALDENNDILADIRDILQDANAVNALFSSFSSGGVASATDLLALIQSGAGLTASNDNASALSVTSLIGQSVSPIITPLTESIGQFTERLGDLPALQQLTIDAVDRGADRVVSSVDSLDDRMDRIESLTRKMLEELEQSNARAAA